MNLPTPSPEEAARSDTLRQRIQNAILKQGSIPFSEYMHRALYTPNLGYYTSGTPKLGQDGDFVTAPEVSPLFGQCIARQIGQILEALNSGNILEFGAGSGKLARDVLLTLAELEVLPERYQIMEVSAHLQAHQKAFLQKSLPDTLFQRIEWLSHLPNPGWKGVVVANEILDAMPVERFYLTPDTAWRMGVGLNKDHQFEWIEMPITEAKLQHIVNRLRDIIHPTQLGYKAEVNLNIYPWLNSISHFMNRGVVLLIDYGFPKQELYQKERLNGTLRCFYKHRVHDNPFIWPGLQDITTHVDFTEVAEAAFSAGFKVTGFTTQAHFLMGTGLLDVASTNLPVIDQLKLAQQIKTLTLPDEMGEVFKVIALSKSLDIHLIGFQLTDLRQLL